MQNQSKDRLRAFSHPSSILNSCSHFEICILHSRVFYSFWRSRCSCCRLSTWWLHRLPSCSSWTCLCTRTILLELGALSPQSYGLWKCPSRLVCYRLRLSCRGWFNRWWTHLRMWLPQWYRTCLFRWLVHWWIDPHSSLLKATPSFRNLPWCLPLTGLRKPSLACTKFSVYQRLLLCVSSVVSNNFLVCMHDCSS